MNFQTRSILTACLICLSIAGAMTLLPSNDVHGQNKAENDAAVERTRQSIKMLDDLYKTAVVGITETYVKDAGDTPAIKVAGAVFDVMKKKGWHEVRLVDASGQPVEEKNLPKDDFEKSAKKTLLGGKDYYEQVTQVDGKPHLRVATPVPVVLKKCVMCHENYKDVKPGVPIGFLSYTVPIK